MLTTNRRERLTPERIKEAGTREKRIGWPQREEKRLAPGRRA